MSYRTECVSKKTEEGDEEAKPAVPKVNLGVLDGVKIVPAPDVKTGLGGRRRKSRNNRRRTVRRRRRSRRVRRRTIL